MVLPNEITKSVKFVSQSCSNSQDLEAPCQFIICFSLKKYIYFSHLKIKSKDGSVAFLLRLGVKMHINSDQVL